MKTKKVIIKWLYWLFLFGFIIQFGGVVSHFYTMFCNPKNESSVMIYSDLRVFSTDSMPSPFQVNGNNELVKPNLYRMPIARSSLIFKQYSEMNFTAWLVLILNTLQYLIWLWFTWLLLRVFQSLNKHQIFELINVTRLRLIAVIVGVSPLLMLIRNLIYPNLFSSYISEVKFRFLFMYDYSALAGVFYMVLILLIVEILKYGITIKHENDLTI